MRPRSISLWFFILLIILAVLLRDQLGAVVPGMGTTDGKRTTNTQELVARWATETVQAGGSSVRGSSVINGAAPAEAQSSSAAAAPPAAPPAASAATPTPVTYTVQASDTLYGIAQQFGVSLEELARLNNLTDPNQLHQGQALRIPDAPALTGDSSVYIVQSGDTLTSIAKRFGISPSELYELNKLVNPNRLMTGARLLLPEGIAIDASAALAVPAVAATAAPTPAPPSTATPLPTPTPDPLCPDGSRQAFTWGVALCQLPDWTLTQVTSPDRAAALTQAAGANQAVFAVLRSGGLPEAPLSLVMLNAQRGLGASLLILPGALAAPAEWDAAIDAVVDGNTARQAETVAVYADGSPARMRLIVFNHKAQRWQVLMAAPADRWDALGSGAFARMLESLRLF